MWRISCTVSVKNSLLPLPLLPLLLLLLLSAQVAQGFVNSPKIICKDGNLIFEAGLNRNISFRLTGKSRVNINGEYDLLDLLNAMSPRRRLIESKDEWSTAEDVASLRQLATDLSDMRLRVFGRDGVNTQLRSLQNRTRSANLLLRRYGIRLRKLETDVQRISTQLNANPCQSNPCENAGKCFQTFNGYVCKCSTSYEGPKCERDVNECALYEGTDLGCQNGAQCVNQFGTYSCICAPGWYGMHCTQRKGDCQQSSTWELCGHGTCVSSNDIFGYKCLCEPGWKTNSLTPACTVDVDECSAEAHTPCLTKCINLPGSFTCAPCAPGLTGNGVTCRDVDECAVQNGGCSLSPRVGCVNTYGSHHCGECPVGWTGDGRTCMRSSTAGGGGGGGDGIVVGGGDGSIGSCAQAASICHPAALCSEISNTVVCSCPVGMLGNGIGPNGCMRGTANNCNALPCLNGGTCIDVGTNYTCLCPIGFQLPNCLPVANPCLPNPCRNGGRCRLSGGTSFICQCAPGYRDRLCNTRFSSCGGMLMGQTGRLKYPPEGTGNEHSAQCAWVLRTNESLVLNVTFNAFNLEDATECRHDWLQINDGRTAASQLIGRFCGRHKPNGGQLISSTNELYLWLRSLNATSTEAFDLTWNSIEPQCGGILNLTMHGTIATPGSPGNYPKNRDCRWQLRAPNDKRIKLTFFSLQIEQHESCNYDYVEIIDSISGRLLQKFCNSTHPAPMLLPTNEALVHFHSDSEGTDTGFQIHYVTEERTPGCGGTYTAKEGNIQSPVSQPGQTLSCEYDIRMAVGESIAIDFTHFEMGPDDCIELYDVDVLLGQRALQEKYCGGYGDQPAPFYSLYNAVQLKYYVNGAGSFRLKYKMDCSYVFESSTGTITSPGYPRLSNEELYCTYKILTAPNTLITVNTIDFDLRDSSLLEDDDCATTYLRINDGLDRNILGPFCGNATPDVDFVSKTNMLLLHFKIGSSSLGRGFKLSYTSVPIGRMDCGGVYTKAGQTIRLPTGDDGVYNNYMECYYVILAPRGKGILLNWKSFDLESSQDCTFDYVEIYDNLANKDDDKPLGRYCEAHNPPDLLTHAQMLTLKFVSDFGDAAEGFELSFQFVDTKQCGGIVHASTGRITSPNFPQNYTSGLDCSWVITGPIGTQIELQVDMFELEQTNGCVGDRLEIRNGATNASTLIGRFCGVTIPTRMPSYTNQMLVDFHTDSFVSARGFRLSWRVFANGCGGIVKAEQGIITSPQYPNNYPHNANCEWHIFVHKGSAIHLKFDDLQMEDLFDCSYDALEVFEGHRINKKPLARICRMDDDDTPLQMDVAKSEATLMFRTDASSNERGFRMSFATNCTRIITINDMEGVIESLNYGEFNYDRALNCNWTIVAPTGNRILVEITHFEFAATTAQERGQAALFLSETMPGGSRVTHTVTTAQSFNVSSNGLSILHNTTAVIFRLEYKMDGCIYVLHKEAGELQSPNFPNMYGNNMECYWEIRTEPGKAIELTVKQMDIEESVNCTKDALVISVHPYEVNYKERHCGRQDKLVLTSSTHRLYLRFKSDDAHNGKGFKASYRILDSVCGGLMVSKNGIIHSPNYPQPYMANANCEWQVEVSLHHRVVLDLEDLDMESGYSCNWDYLEAVDGFEPDDEDNKEGDTLFKVCGTDPAVTHWQSTSNIVLVRFISDDSNQEKGFKLHFHEACGERVLIDEMDFSYLQFNRHALTNETCQWQLVAADSKKRIIFTPTHVVLHPEAIAEYKTESDCSVHGIQVFEGEKSLGLPAAQFCKTHPPAIVSMGNSLTIALRTDTIMEFEGHYMTMDTVCGSVYNALSGKFASPYYPSSYPVNIDCEWAIEASLGNSITLTFESMDLEESSECNNDYVEVRENDSRGQLLGVFCGNKVPAVIAGKELLWIKFKSNDDVVGGGFLASYNYEKHNEISGTNGTIQSPHYPTKLQVAEPYSWRITVDKDHVVLLTFKHIVDIDMPYIKLYDGYSDIGVQIDYGHTHVVISHTNIIYLTAKRGPFEFEWEHLSKDALRSNRSAEEQAKVCGREAVSVSNTLVFNSPGYPMGYESNMHCSWLFVPNNVAMHAVLQFNQIDLEEFAECFADYVTISESADLTTWHQLDKLCAKPNATVPKKYHGKPYLKLNFVTDAGVNKTGFSSYIRTMCGSELTEQSALINITSLVMPGIMFQMDCVWTIRVRQGRRVRISFPDSQIRDPNESASTLSLCRTFFVVRNGFAEDSPFLGRGKYCDSDITDVLETTANRAYIKFKSFGYMKFRAAFRYEEISHECSEDIVLREDSGGEGTIVTTPHYPNLPNPYSECVWRITAPTHHVIAIHFMGDFDLSPGNGPISEACDREYVQINDGTTELMPLLGRYCGKNKPDTVYSTGNVLRLKYFTDVPEPRLGFKALLNVGRCGGTYYSSEGTLSSPEHLQLQVNDRNFECVYIIEMEKGSTIELVFEHIQLPQSSNCSTVAHLQLDEIDEFSDSVAKLTDRVYICGTDPKKFIVETNKVRIHYKLQGVTPQEGDGFRVRYKAIGARCGETIVAYRGVLQTPGYPGGVRTPLHCSWRIRVPKGQRVEVEVVDFDTGAPGSPNGGFVRMFRGRLTFANDFKMQSIIGRYSEDPPAVIYSTDNTMAIDAFLLPFSRHRGFKLVFRGSGLSSCYNQFDLLIHQSRNVTFNRSNSSVIYCSYDLAIPKNTTLALDVLKHTSRAIMMANQYVCSVVSPLKLELYGVQLLPRLLCQNGTIPTVRLPFATHLELSGSKRNELEQLELAYKLYDCGGVRLLEVGDNMNITQPSMPLEHGSDRLECAWAVWPHDFTEENIEKLDYLMDGVQIELSVSTDFVGDCVNQYLLLYNGPDQNSPHLGRYCSRQTITSLVVERGLFFEYHTDSYERKSTFNVTLKHGSGCGGKISYPYRDIYFDEQYKNNVECVWEIETESGFTLGLTFIDRFYIETSADCKKDYLKVQQKSPDDSDWVDVRTLCGREPPAAVNTTATQMRLIFRSDGDVTADGFTARLERNCGGLLYATQTPAVLASPGYPVQYEKNLYCNYTILPADASSAGVLVRFLDFDIEQPPVSKCMFDNVTVQTTDEQSELHESVICGVKKQHEYRGKKAVSVVLRTDYSFSGKGFQLEYSTNVCGGTISQAGIIESPRQHTDNKFPPSSNCFWNLTAPEGSKIIIKFNEIDYENELDCRYDAVEIYQGLLPLEYQRLAVFCGNLTGHLPTLSISMHQGLIHAFSDARDSSLGFRALVRFIPNCDQRVYLAANNLTYKFDKYAGSYAANLDCGYVFSSTVDRQLQIEFQSFHVEATPNCEGDFLEIRDGAGPFADLIGRFCGHDLPTKMMSSRNNLYVRFVSDSSTQDVGFAATVTGVPLICGQHNIKLDEQTTSFVLSSPQAEDDNYQSNLNCYWRITGKKNLHLQFTRLDLQASTANGSCNSDYLKIYNKQDAALVENGYGSKVVFSGHMSGMDYRNFATEHVYCGSGQPSDYYANANEVYVKFHMDGVAGKRGFSLTARQTEGCFRNFTGLQGRIKISDTSDHCDIYVKAPANYTLSIYYDDLAFSEFDCSAEYVEVFDLHTNKSLQKVCSYLETGKSLFTDTNELRMRIKMNGYYSDYDMTYVASARSDGIGCGGMLYNTAGIITNPFYPQNVRNNSDCRWQIRVPANNHLLLRFDRFDLGAKSTCHSDYLQLIERNEHGDEIVVRQFCGEDRPSPYKSARSELTVRFHKTVNYDGTGWVLRFQGVYANYQIPNYYMN